MHTGRVSTATTHEASPYLNSVMPPYNGGVPFVVYGPDSFCGLYKHLLCRIITCFDDCAPCSDGDPDNTLHVIASERSGETPTNAENVEVACGSVVQALLSDGGPDNASHVIASERSDETPTNAENVEVACGSVVQPCFHNVKAALFCQLSGKRVLTIGDGDLSFSRSLQSNYRALVTATTLLWHRDLDDVYGPVWRNNAAFVSSHRVGVDVRSWRAKNMTHPDVIFWNFPCPHKNGSACKYATTFHEIFVIVKSAMSHLSTLFPSATVWIWLLQSQFEYFKGKESGMFILIYEATPSVVPGYRPDFRAPCGKKSKLNNSMLPSSSSFKKVSTSFLCRVH